MSIYFSREFIDELLRQVDMLTVMEKYGVAVKAGTGGNHYFVADFCCGKKDFDNGRIKKSTQTYLCMSCNQGGNALHFLTRVVGKSFPDAVVELAEMFDVDLPEEDPEKSAAQKRKELALKLAAEFYFAQANYEYMTNRGISEEVLKRHKIGYAPGGRALRNHLEKHGFSKEELREYRLINAKGMDSLFYRAVVPVVMHGKVTDLYGRAVDDSKVGIRHFYLYGENILNGIDHIKPKSLVTLFESAIDRLAAETHGIDNGVDCGGAHKFTTYHAKRLKRKGVDKVLIIFDADDAGREGAIKAGQMLVDEGIRVWVGELPDGMDPARMLKEQGREAFLASLQNPKTFEKFKMYHELAKYPLEEIETYVAEMKAAETKRKG